MKKIVMFYMTYKSGNIEGHRISTCTYSIFTRKSKMVDDLFEWQVEQQKIISQGRNEGMVVTNLKIIGL